MPQGNTALHGAESNPMYLRDNIPTNHSSGSSLLALPGSHKSIFHGKYPCSAPSTARITIWKARQHLPPRFKVSQHKPRKAEQPANLSFFPQIQLQPAVFVAGLEPAVPRQLCQPCRGSGLRLPGLHAPAPGALRAVPGCCGQRAPGRAC